MSKLRLVKVIVQPVFVLDDGETVSEVEHPPIAIPAAEWPTYSSERFPRELAEWQQRLDEEEQARRPNRAQRRAAAREKGKSGAA